MAGHKELIKKLSEDDALRQELVDTPTREGKQEAVRNAGLEVPDHHDVLQEVAGGTDMETQQAGVIGVTVGGVSAAVAAAAAAVEHADPMAGQKELIKKLSVDDALRQKILDTPTREGKNEVIRNAGLEVPDHHDVLQEVAGGVDLSPGATAGLAAIPTAAALAAAAAAV